MNFMSQEQTELEIEWNSQFDDHHERYAAEVLDPMYEGYCTYCCDCEEEGFEPDNFLDWEAEQKAAHAARNPRSPFFVTADFDGIPF